MITILIPRSVDMQYCWDMLVWLDTNIGYKDNSALSKTWNWDAVGEYFVFSINNNYRSQAATFKLRFG